MKIKEIVFESQHLEEGPVGDTIKKVGTGVGKAVGGVAKGVGAVAGGVAGIGRAFKKGFQSGKATVAGDPDPNAASGSGGTAPAASGGSTTAPASAADTKDIVTQFGQLPPEQQKDVLDKIQKQVASTPTPAPAAAAPAAEKPAAGPGSSTAGTTAGGQPKTEPDLNAPAASGGTTAPAATGSTATTDTPAATATSSAPAASGAAPAAAKPAAPGAKTTAPANKAASDTFEKAKGDIRKVQSGTKPLPDNMAQGVQADIAKMAKGDKESGVAAAQKIMGFAQRGMDVAALQQAWAANAKAGERFLSQSVYREITNMLREHGLIWSDLNLQVRLDESVSQGVFIRYAKPVTESVSLFRIK